MLLPGVRGPGVGVGHGRIVVVGVSGPGVRVDCGKVQPALVVGMRGPGIGVDGGRCFKPWKRGPCSAPVPTRMIYFEHSH